MRKKLAVILAATMVLNSFTVPAFANDYVDVVAVEDDSTADEDEAVVGIEEDVEFEIEESGDSAEYFDEEALAGVGVEAPEEFEDIEAEETTVEEAEEIAAPSESVRYVIVKNIPHAGSDGVDWRYYPNLDTKIWAHIALQKQVKEGEDWKPQSNVLHYIIGATGTFNGVLYNGTKDVEWSYIASPSVSLTGLKDGNDTIVVKDEKNTEISKLTADKFVFGDNAENPKYMSVYGNEVEPEIAGYVSDITDITDLEDDTTLYDGLNRNDLDTVVVNVPVKNATCFENGAAVPVTYYVMPNSNLPQGVTPKADAPVIGYKADKEHPVTIETVAHYFIEDKTFLVADYDSENMVKAGATEEPERVFTFGKSVTPAQETAGRFFKSKDEGNNITINDKGEAELLDPEESGKYYQVTREYCENKDATRYRIEEKTIERYMNKDHYSSFENIRGYLTKDTNGNWHFVEVTKNDDVELVNIDPSRTDLIVLQDCTKKGSFKQYTPDTTGQKRYVTATYTVPAHDSKVVMVLGKEADRSNNKLLTAKNGFASLNVLYKKDAKVSEVTDFTVNGYDGYWVPEAEVGNIEVQSNVCYEDVEYRLATFCANDDDTKFIPKGSELKKAARGTNHVFDVDSRNRLKDTSLTPVIAGKGKDAKLIGYGFGLKKDVHTYDDSENVKVTRWTFDYYIKLDENDHSVGKLYELKGTEIRTTESTSDAKFLNDNKIELGTIKLGESSATCAIDGEMDVTPVCTLCKTDMTTIRSKVNKHTEQPGEPTRRILEDSTCSKQGKALIETKCVICDRVLSSKEEIIQKKKHKFANVSVDFKGNEVVIANQATDDKSGTEHVDLVNASANYQLYGETQRGVYATGDTYIGRTNYQVLAEANYTCTVCGEELNPGNDNVDKDAARAAMAKQGITLATSEAVYITNLVKEKADSRDAGSITIKIVAYGYDKDGNVVKAEKEITKPYYSDWLAYLDRVNPEERERLVKAQEAAEKAAAIAKENPTSININAADNAVIAAKAIGADTTKAEADLAEARKAFEEAEKKAAEEAAKKAAEETAKKAAEAKAKEDAERAAAKKVADAKAAAENAANDALTAANAALSNPTDSAVKTAKDAVTAANDAISAAKKAGADTTTSSKTVALANTTIAAAEKLVKEKVPTISFGNSKVTAALMPGGKITNRIFLKKGQTLKLKAKASDGSKVYYRAVNDRIVSCSKTGKVKGLKAGRTRVVVTTKNGAKCEILFRVKK